MPDDNALAAAIAEARKNIEQRVTALIEEARRENCLFFRCRLDLNAPALPIQIRFSDRAGRIYRRNIACDRLFRKLGVTLTLGRATDLMKHAQSLVLATEGIQPDRRRRDSRRA
jgi:hypothetical protein